MLSPQQAFDLFRYADYAMMFVGLVAFIASFSFCIFAILPMNKGRRRRLLIRALISFLVLALFYGTQCSKTIAIFNEHFTPLLLVLFALPVVVMLAGLIASIAFAVYAVLRKTGQQRRQIVLKSLLGVVVFGVGVAPHTTFMLIPILSAQDHSNHPGTLTHVGEPVPDFILTSIEGTPYNTTNLRGKVVVLNFFATWCGPCQIELRHLQAVWNEFQNNNDFRMIVVGREESDASLKAFKQENGFTFPMASDMDRSVYNKFATDYIPRTYLISRKGTIVYQCTGYYEEEIARLKKMLNKELAKKN